MHWTLRATDWSAKSRPKSVRLRVLKRARKTLAEARDAGVQVVVEVSRLSPMAGSQALAATVLELPGFPISVLHLRSALGTGSFAAFSAESAFAFSVLSTIE